ncbi:hypothetical protein LCGC14_0846640 [marine sediment metagenome]|uniref:Uncharacterized protein n=1 Tax=marine sediment metagenome TaxID=412755 RepID=A0A0F9RWD1_9ZZZZ
MKRCNSCNKELISFKGMFLHIDNPCSGIEDGISIDMNIVDEGLNEKWKELYSFPEKDDYDVRIEQEQEIEGLNRGMKTRQDRIDQLVSNLKTTKVNKDLWEEQAIKEGKELEELKIKNLKIEAKIEGHWLLRRLWKWISPTL